MIAERFQERFWSRVEKSDGCWLWKLKVNRTGYAHFTADWKRYKAHRLAYELTRGPIPEGLVLDHLCRVRHCVNPDHLEPVTNRENVLRGISPPAAQAAQTACRNGHPFDAENTRYVQRGRVCRACVVIKKRRARQRRALAGTGETPSGATLEGEATG